MAKPGEKFFIDARGIKASGIVTENGFIALAGSEVQPTTSSYLKKSLQTLRNKYFLDGTIKGNVLAKDIQFKSPSSAAEFLLGTSASGPQTWKDANGMTMHEHNKLEKGVFISSEDREYLGFYKIVTGNEGNKCHYPARLDTYGCGCGHDCSYCYAKDMILRTSGEWNPAHPKLADLWRIENRLKKGEIKEGDIVRLGGLTDCFQPAEVKYRITLDTIRLLNKYNVGYLIVTKSHIVADDEYISVMRRDLAHIQLTVTTFDQELCFKHEKASSPQKRVEAIEKLQRLGFDICLRLSPYVEGWIDFEKLNQVHCDKVLVEFLRLNASIKAQFNVDDSNYTHKHNGYLNLPLDKKKEILSKIVGFKEVTVCDDCDGHYEFFRDHFNPNPDDCCNLRK